MEEETVEVANKGVAAWEAATAVVTRNEAVTGREKGDMASGRVVEMTATKVVVMVGMRGAKTVVMPLRLVVETVVATGAGLREVMMVARVLVEEAVLVMGATTWMRVEVTTAALAESVAVVLAIAVVTVVERVAVAKEAVVQEALTAARQGRLR